MPTVIMWKDYVTSELPHHSLPSIQEQCGYVRSAVHESH